MKDVQKKKALGVKPRKIVEDVRSRFLARHKEDVDKLKRTKNEYGRVLLNKARAPGIVDDEFTTKERGKSMQKEKNSIRAQLWVASGKPYQDLDKQYMDVIQCQVKCQERLFLQVSNLKKCIANMQHEIDRVIGDIYQFNNKVIPECRHQEYVAEKRKKFQILENKYEQGVRMECAVTATNAELRQELMNLQIDRQNFSEKYTKMIHILTSDKKYLLELIDYAMMTFDQCFNMYEMIDNQHKKDLKDAENYRQESHELESKQLHLEDKKFVENKNRKLPLLDIQPKEQKRRETRRNNYKRRVTLYREVLEKLLEYTNTVRVEDVIRKFKEQENVYYSYFTYANETGYHMTLLNNKITRLSDEINNLKATNRTTLSEQLATIGQLQTTLRNKRQSNDELLQKSEQGDNHIEELFTEIGLLCEMTECDATELWNQLGDNTQINLMNLATNTKMLEERLLDIIAFVYCEEHPNNTTITEIEKYQEMPTKLSDIVLTQQCPECVLGESMGVEDDGNNYLLPKEEIYKKLYEKFTQPEMQYNLHDLAHCRLPRSRILAAKQNM